MFIKATLTNPLLWWEILLLYYFYRICILPSSKGFGEVYMVPSSPSIITWTWIAFMVGSCSYPTTLACMDSCRSGPRHFGGSDRKSKWHPPFIKTETDWSCEQVVSKFHWKVSGEHYHGSDLASTCPSSLQGPNLLLERVSSFPHVVGAPTLAILRLLQIQSYTPLLS